MIATKKAELHIINDFTDLMKDTKERQRINKLIKQFSYEYFMNKLSDTELENDKTIFDTFQDLATHNQKYSYIITRNIKDKIIDDYSYEEEYYDGSYTREGQLAKKRKVLDRNKVGKDFGESLEEELNNLVLEDYFKNLNKALETYNFNNKIENLKERAKARTLKNSSEEIDKIIEDNIRGLYNHYKESKNTNYQIVYAFKNDREVIDFLYNIILSSIKEELDIVLSKADIETRVEKEIKRFTSSINVKEQEEDKIPLGWKAFALTEFINKLLK